jgi:hypothetical protein
MGFLFFLRCKKKEDILKIENKPERRGAEMNERLIFHVDVNSAFLVLSHICIWDACAKNIHLRRLQFDILVERYQAFQGDVDHSSGNEILEKKDTYELFLRA